MSERVATVESLQLPSGFCCAQGREGDRVTTRLMVRRHVSGYWQSPLSHADIVQLRDWFIKAAKTEAVK